jgi:hypothetical protein
MLSEFFEERAKTQECGDGCLKPHSTSLSWDGPMPVATSLNGNSACVSAATTGAAPVRVSHVL